MQDPTGKVEESFYKALNNSCTLQNIMWQHSPKWKCLGELQNSLTTLVNGYLYKDLDDDGHTAVDKQTVSLNPTMHVAMAHQQLTPHSYHLWLCDRNVVHVTESKIKITLTCEINHLCIYVYEYMHLKI